MTEHGRHLNLIFGEGFQRCPKTGRPYENGSGALSHAEQTALFLREQALERPRQGEVCPQTGRPYDCSVGSLPKLLQSAAFLEELPPEIKAQRQADANALLAVKPSGTA